MATATDEIQVTYDPHSDGTTITLDEQALSGIKDYALSVLRAMRKASPAYADCWEACCITFDDIQPQFMFGGKADIEDMDFGEQQLIVIDKTA